VKRMPVPSVHADAVCIRDWWTLAVRGSRMGCGIALPRERVPWLVRALGSLPASSACPIPSHIVRAWGPLCVLVSPTGVRIWRNPGAWPVEGVAITAAEAPHVVEAVARVWS
jgi:hypothetical protein